MQQIESTTVLALTQVKKNQILIGIELATTIWLIPFNSTVTTEVFVALLLSVIWFAAMLYYRQKVVVKKAVKSTTQQVS